MTLDSPRKVISDIPRPAEYFANMTEYNATALSVIEASLPFPETVAILRTKVRCLRGGSDDDAGDPGSGFAEYQLLIILDSISQTLNGDSRLASQLSVIYLFDVDYGGLTNSRSPGNFGLQNEQPFLAFCQDLFSGQAEDDDHLHRLLAEFSSHEAHHFKQWSEGRLDVSTMKEIHQVDALILRSFQNKVPLPQYVDAANQAHVGEGVGHPLEVEAQNRALEITNQISYLN